MAIGSLIGAGVGLAGGILGGISASKKRKEMRKMLENQKKENQEWFDRNYNEDATQRADTQRLLTMTEDSIRNRNKAAAARSAVMGGTDASVAIEKEAANKAMADIVSDINANNEQRKDSIEQQYIARKQELDGAAYQQKQDELAQIQKATAASMKTGSEIGSSVDDYVELMKKG